MVKLNKAVFFLQSVCYYSCFYSSKSSPCTSNSWEWMPALLGKECSCAFSLGHILPPHRHLCFVKYSRNYSWSMKLACTMILPCPAIFIALLTRQYLCQLVSAGRTTGCTPGACGRITTFLSTLCHCLFDPVLLPHNVVWSWILNNLLPKCIMRF